MNNGVIGPAAAQSLLCDVNPVIEEAEGQRTNQIKASFPGR